MRVESGKERVPRERRNGRTETEATEPVDYDGGGGGMGGRKGEGGEGELFAEERGGGGVRIVRMAKRRAETEGREDK